MSIIINGTEEMKAQDPSLATNSYELLGEATTLVTGEGDTVATSLTMTMRNLDRHSAIYKQPVKQLSATLSQCEDIDSKTVIAHVPLVDAVLNESMRLNSVLPDPMWHRTDNPIQVCGYAVTGATGIKFMRLFVLQNAKAFHRPKEFTPKRWLNDLGNNLKAFQPFGVGPRKCICRHIAIVKIHLIFVRLLWNFDWELVTEKYDNPEYVVMYRSPLWIRASGLKADRNIYVINIRWDTKPSYRHQNYDHRQHISLPS